MIIGRKRLRVIFKRFETHAKHYKWDDDEKMFQLPN